MGRRYGSGYRFTAGLGSALPLSDPHFLASAPSAQTGVHQRGGQR